MNTRKTTAEVESAIESLDLEPILVKLMDSNSGESWSLDYARYVESWYRRFLLLSFKFRNRSIVINDAIDTFWHYHILDTRKYADDCNVIFGYFLHHFPYFGLRGEEDARNLQDCYKQTVDLFRNEFGEDLDLAFRRRLLESSKTPFSRLEAPVGSQCSDCDHYTGDDSVVKGSQCSDCDHYPDDDQGLKGSQCSDCDHYSDDRESRPRSFNSRRPRLALTANS
jgi:hypothetical protein